jgi:RNA polymerase sigma factor (sigma-70 family)
MVLALFATALWAAWRIPVHVVERINKINRAERDFWAEYGKEPTLEDLAEETGIPLAYVQEARSAADASKSLNQAVGEDGESELGDLLADPDALDPSEEAAASIEHQNIRKALQSLPERERRVLELRFGIGGGEGMTLEEIGKELDLTRERVRQIENDSLWKIGSLQEVQAMVEDPTFNSKLTASRARVILSETAKVLSVGLSEKSLTDTQCAILELIMIGRDKNQIVAILGLSEKTVRVNTNTLKSKLGVEDNEEAAGLAFRTIQQQAAKSG